MSTRYDKRMTAFSDVGVSLMRMSLEYRYATSQDERAFAERRLAAYEKGASTWVAAERDAMIASLRARLAPASTAQHATAAAATPAPADSAALKDLTDADRSLLAQALDAEHQGRADDAWLKAQPLFTRYPSVYTVQDMRCRLAMARGLSWTEARKECEALMGLSGARYTPK
jgi:hypothetical protein